MSLLKYNEKRIFSSTPEPGPEKESSNGPLRFVVQEHAAKNLHYDFRLEMGGVLKSWAVPKGPSMNPHDKRLAVMVEDHPLAYRNFEGVIPEGNYGAGVVKIWDKGSYNAEGFQNRAKGEEALLKELDDGEIKFLLDGNKLKGLFVLVKMQGRGENAWLLIKQKDSNAIEKYNDKD